jgi:hypothetical protein
MDKVTISNLQGESGLVNVVRYFNNNGVEYLIYSLNEVDEAGYTRLYVTKLNGVDGMYTADTLNDNEWNEIKNLVKIIVKSNKEGMPTPVQDLNPKKINNILLKDKKVFKLNAPLVNDLSANKPNFDTTDNDGSEQKTIQNDIPSAPAFETPVQPTFEVPSAPTFETPVQPTFDFNATFGNNTVSDSNTMNNGTQDNYKEMYEEQLNKNKELQAQIDHYKELFNNVKNIIEK